MSDNKSNLKLGAIISYLWVIVHIGVNFVYAPLLLQFLGKGEYGLYQVVASFLAYINVLETSLSAGVLRYYCNAKAKGNIRDTENILAICRKIYRKLTGIVLFVGVVVIYVFRAFYQSSFSHNELLEGSVMLGLLVFNLVITLNNALYLACIRGNERFVFERALSIISQILQPLIVIMILLRLPYAVSVTFIQVAINVVVSVIRYFYAKRELKIRVVLHENDKLLERSVLLFASGILLSNIADRIFWNTDQIILAKFYSTSVVAVYAIGSQIASNYMYVGTTVASVFFPRVSTYYEEENGLKKISDLFIKVGRIAFLLCLLVLSGFVIFGKEFLFLWVGEDFIPAYMMALVIIIPFTIDMIQNLGLTILQVMNKYGFRAKMYFVAAALNIVSTIILSYFFAGFGAALSTGLTMFITSGLILNWYYAKKIKLDIVAFWKNIFSIFLKLLPLILVSFMINYLLDLKWCIGFFAIKIIIYTVLYGLVAYFLAMNEYERSISVSVLNKILKSAKGLF